MLAELLPRYIEQQVYGAMLEAIASEQSARMVAMRNATDNANELMRDLTLVYNKARQESITGELLDIVGGVAALTLSDANGTQISQMVRRWMPMKSANVNQKYLRSSALYLRHLR